MILWYLDPEGWSHENVVRLAYGQPKVPHRGMTATISDPSKKALSPSLGHMLLDQSLDQVAYLHSRASICITSADY